MGIVSRTMGTMNGATSSVLLLFVLTQACLALQITPRAEVDEDGCITQVVLVEEVTYDEELQCRHLPQQTCMQTMTTKYKTTKDEECKDTFTKDCYIEYINVPKSEEVERCVTPWERDCDTPSTEQSCSTEYETICETIYHENEVEDDVTNCNTVDVCKDGSEDTDNCELVPRQACEINQETNKKYTKETECSKEPREVCGPESCPLVQGDKVCDTETKTFVQQQPEENCDLISRKVCTPTMKVVPSMEPMTKCVEVGKEICEYVKINPRAENKPQVKKICGPIEQDLLEEDNDNSDDGSGDEEEDPESGSGEEASGEEGSGEEDDDEGSSPAR